MTDEQIKRIATFWIVAHALSGFVALGLIGLALFSLIH